MKQYIVLLRSNRNYRFLWLGSVITQLGDWFNLLASAQLITGLSGSGIAVSYLFLARFVPLFVFSPVAGVLADRFNRRHIMIFTDLLRAGTVLSLLLINSPSRIWLLYLLTITQFSLSALFTPARTAVLSNVVERQDLVTANALDSLTWSTMLALGAFLGGIVAAVLGIAAAFVMDAFTFVFSAWCISRIVVLEYQRETEAPAQERGWLTFVGGFRYLLGVPFVMGVSLAKGAGSLVWGAINVLEINYADKIFPINDLKWFDRLHIESGASVTLGIVYVISGLGTGIGPIFLRRIFGDAYHRMLWAVAVGFVLLSGGILGLSISPSLGIFSFATLVRTVGSGVVWVFSAALLQMLVPDSLRGRVFAFEFAVLTLTQSISTYLAGFFQDNLGLSVRQTTAIFGITGLVMSALWLIFMGFHSKQAKQLEEQGGIAI
ncbi:MAG: MFS transporter [Ardenticatenaceae bacterium]|nr:MFS transporter [Ardenticatenaceae bacterium]